ncbi:hypothetical protein EYF80_027978 [Liparis tanakae]|uniref:Uncharacterized protein n=1 Tax=Liparis tanakae TaxID=230148 RepID=A0A4Z2H7L1_9TELE|nr:hypothetical protein EYF80_027978 [Liparis tanakae]
MATSGLDRAQRLWKYMIGLRVLNTMILCTTAVRKSKILAQEVLIRQLDRGEDHSAEDEIKGIPQD